MTRKIFSTVSAFALAAASVFVLSGSVVQASPTSITYIGSLIDVPFGWRTSVPSEFNLSGLNILGADGYYIPGTNERILAPSYVVDLSIGYEVDPGAGGNALIDDPSTTPGPDPSTIVSGTSAQTPGSGFSAATFSFTLGGTVPSLIQVGILEDNLQDPANNSSAVQLAGSGDLASSLVSLTDPDQNDGVPDWYFFDIVGGVADQTFSVVNTSGQNCACLGGVTFDSSTMFAGVPEPTTWTLMLAGFGGLGAALRTRRRSFTARA
jgi:hypothetical protein